MKKINFSFILSCFFLFSCSNDNERLVPLKDNIHGQEIIYYDASTFFRTLFKKLEANSNEDKNGYAADVDYFMKGEESPIKWKSGKDADSDISFVGEICLGNKDGVFTTLDPYGNLIADSLTINTNAAYGAHSGSLIDEISFGAYDRGGGSPLMSSIEKSLVDNCKEIHLNNEFSKETINNFNEFMEIGTCECFGYVVTKGGLKINIRYESYGGSGGWSHYVTFFNSL